MKIPTGLFVFALLLGAAGCGQTSYFEVTVAIANQPPVDSSCLFTITACEIKVNGLGGDSFTLKDEACRAPTSHTLGTFQYSTEEDSGTVSFHVTIVAAVNGKSTIIGEADSAPASVKSGGRQPVTVTVPVTCPSTP